MCIYVYILETLRETAVSKGTEVILEQDGKQRTGRNWQETRSCDGLILDECERVARASHPFTFRASKPCLGKDREALKASM